jgi:hypothetical protein
LEQPNTKKEFKEVVEEMTTWKAPILDGIAFDFLMKFWPIIG